MICSVPVAAIAQTRVGCPTAGTPFLFCFICFFRLFVKDTTFVCFRSSHYSAAKQEGGVKRFALLCFVSFLLACFACFAPVCVPAFVLLLAFVRWCFCCSAARLLLIACALRTALRTHVHTFTQQTSRSVSICSYHTCAALLVSALKL